MGTASEWNAVQYLKFEDDRTRAARDLLAAVPLERVKVAVDIGCGPGNSTELIAARYPEARVSGFDSSEDMLAQARKRLPGCEFFQGDAAGWMPGEPVDLLFANAVFQWVPDHAAVMRRLVQALPEGGVLAAQMPDNTREPSHLLVKELTGPGFAESARADLPSPCEYYDLLRPVCRRVEIWHTVYNHALAGPEGIVEWFKGSALRPFLNGLDAGAAADFLAEYTRRIAESYPVRVDGKVLLRFPRLFVVAVR
jgi:trans-aconitate 2-methyltransferase